MIDFNYEADFSLDRETKYIDWINRVITSESKTVGDLSFIFCDDTYLLDINMKYLDHDTLTDIITFDYCSGSLVSGDIFISVERVLENANSFQVSFEMELQRVLSHGVLHLMGYKDKLDKDIVVMRQKEEDKIKLFHVEH